MQALFRCCPSLLITVWQNVSAKHEHWNGISQGTPDQAIKLSSTYFDDKSKTSKLLILISDGEDHSEGAQAAEEANKQGMRIITIGLGTEKEELFL
jgi:hypothetical protein